MVENPGAVCRGTLTHVLPVPSPLMLCEYTVIVPRYVTHLSSMHTYDTDGCCLHGTPPLFSSHPSDVVNDYVLLPESRRHRANVKQNDHFVQRRNSSIDVAYTHSNQRFFPIHLTWRLLIVYVT